MSNNRCTRAHKRDLEVLLRSRWRAFGDWVEIEAVIIDSCDSQQITKLIDSYTEPSVEGQLEKLHATDDQLAEALPPVPEILDTFCMNENDKSHAFALWSNYIELIRSQLDLVRSEREGV